MTSENEFKREDRLQESFMQLALAEAIKGAGWVSPNPLVGAVIVKNGHVIGKGYHQKYGELHAERNAIAACTESIEGADLYVTLEPCCHYGKTPPCTEAIIEHKIKRVYVGSMDPNPLVAGKGVQILREQGIEVVTGVLQEQCLELNRVFFHYIQNKKPYVILKYAMTADGKIATDTGLSQWITGEDARANVHKDRHRYAAIMVGVNTVLADDPSLTARIEGMQTKNPVRIIVDSHLRTPLKSRLVQTAHEIPTIIATISDDEEKKQEYQEYGCKIITTEGIRVDLSELMSALGKRGIDSVIIEGGGELNWSALQAQIVDHVQAYIAPKIFGGKTAKTPVSGQGVQAPADAYQLEQVSITQLGCDLLMEGDVSYVHRNY